MSVIPGEHLISFRIWDSYIFHPWELGWDIMYHNFWSAKLSFALSRQFPPIWQSADIAPEYSMGDLHFRCRLCILTVQSASRCKGRQSDTIQDSRKTGWASRIQDASQALSYFIRSFAKSLSNFVSMALMPHDSQWSFHGKSREAFSFSQWSRYVPQNRPRSRSPKQ